MMKPKKEALDIATLYNRWLNECERIKSPCTVRAFTITINISVLKTTSIWKYTLLRRA